MTRSGLPSNRLPIAALVVLAGIVSALGGPGGEIQFPNPLFHVGIAPGGIAAGRFNGDSRPDVAISNSSENDVSVLLGLGDGTFSRQRRYPVGDYPTVLVAADFDGDGRDDLAVANRDSHDISLLLGRGDGTFLPESRHPLGDVPLRLIAADFNGDGRTDLVAVNYGPGDLSLLMGKGGAGFMPESRIVPIICLSAMAVNDFDRDGFADLTITCGASDEVAVYFGGPSGTLIPRTRFKLGGIVSSEPVGIVAADLNGDGNPDLATVNHNSNDVKIFLGHGDGTFADGGILPTARHPSGINAGDFTGDGGIDLIVAGPDRYTLSLHPNTGDGSFGNPRPSGDGIDISILAVTDFNGDGRDDLALPQDFFIFPGAVAVLLSNGDGTLGTDTTFPAGRDPFNTAAGDIDGDANIDLLVLSHNPNEISYLHGQGDGSFAAETRFRTTANPGGMVVGDLNRDGRDDVVVVGSIGDVVVHLGAPKGTFAKMALYTVGTSPRSAVIADLNQDGRPDLAVANFGATLNGLPAEPLGDVSILIGLGNGTFAEEYRVSAGTHPTSLAVADMNGDGNADLLVGENPAGVTVLLGRGDGTFQELPMMPSYVGEVVRLAVGDFNGDGNQDVATVNEGPLLHSSAAGDSVPAENPECVNATVLTGQGDGTLGSLQCLPSGILSLRIVSADFNGDGIDDLAFADFLRSTFVILPGNRSGVPGPMEQFSSGGRLNSLSPADFNGDGRLDLAGALINQGVSVILGRSPVPVAGVLIDIKPGEFPNLVNPGSHGCLSVAVLGSRDLAAGDIDPASLSLSGAGLCRAASRSADSSCLSRDVDGDGLDDLVCRFATDQMVLEPEASTAVLEGRTFDNRRFRGDDAVRLVPGSH